MIKCICCKELHDEQYISKYETLYHVGNKSYIKVCETCFNEFSEYDGGSNMNYIYWEEKCFFPSSQIV
jgi:hypothetical protein